MTTCSGIKADGSKDDCKCDLYREEIINPTDICVNVGCGHHKGQHNRRPDLQPFLPQHGMRLKDFLNLF